ECNKTWKKWHNKAIEEILVYDAFAVREKSHTIGPAAVEFANYNRATWRRVNDAIIWLLMGAQRHVVKRLCLYRPRTFLQENNATSAMSTIAMLNSDPMSIAIWNDATSSVDIGDVTYLKRVGADQELWFLELKEGP